ncbi:hypothetical protein Sango_2188200 [Sesamum angolense]|uniref:DUF7812 domain-containing protein n=1 Tax=Sesamum angolense TaxID=2727404 RepID=A0AAE2BMW6_9LAMI|nr:hypothetical protein Sango_2188200 [Sesamum angolense]
MMGSTKKSTSKKRARSQCSNEDFSDYCRDFRTLFSIIQSPEGMKPPVLKNLYHLLIRLSSSAQWSVKYAVGSPEHDLEICDGGIRVTFGDIRELSNVLFKELEERFERLFSIFSRISANKDLGESNFHQALCNAVEIMNLLFRCCMLLLTLLAAKPNLILEKGPIFLRIVRKLSSPNLVENTGTHAFVFEKSFFHECAPADNGCSTSYVEGFTASIQFLEPCNPLLFLKSTMLEVFVDELLVHGQSRGCFKLINSVASINEMIFNPHSAHCDIGIVIEAMCHHFILSFSDKQAFGDFLSRLFCTHAKELKYTFGAPALGVTAAISLLLSPFMVSAPRYMQAHLISLVSEAIDIKILKPDRRITNCFLSTFEKSVTLYIIYMSCSQIDGYSALPMGFTSISSHDIAHPPFEFYILPETKSKVDSLITELENSSNHNQKDSFFRMKSDLVSSSMRFVKECQNLYVLPCQDEILAILSCLVLKASESYDDKAIRPVEGTMLQHVYLLASLLKLMSISLLQAIWCLRHSDDSQSMKNLKYFSSCKEYDMILGTITCFRDLDISLPLQQVLSSAMSSHSMRHKDSKMMFFHFSGLMSLSFVSGLDCLVKACLLTILALLNLFVFEEGDLDALESMVDSYKESSSSGSPVVRLQETLVDQNSSLVVAFEVSEDTVSVFELKAVMSWTRESIKQYILVTENNCNEMETLRSQTLANASQEEPVASLEEETEETCNGETFFKCVLKMNDNISDFDDLVGFVECKQVWNAGCVAADVAAAFAVASVDDIEIATSQFLSLTSLAPLGNIFEKQVKFLQKPIFSHLEKGALNNH